MPLMQGQTTQLGSSALVTGGATALTGAGLFTDTCTVLENQGASDGMGGFLDDWQVIGTYDCTIKALTPVTERSEGERVTAIGVYEISLPSDAVVDPADRIVCNGITYEVQDRDSKLTNQTFIKVRARRIN